MVLKASRDTYVASMLSQRILRPIQPNSNSKVRTREMSALEDQ